MISDSKWVRSLSELPIKTRWAAVTLGSFDGVHRGHRSLLERLRSAAAPHQGEVIVVTFHPHPLRVVAPQRAPKLIMTYEARAQALLDCGVDVVVDLPFESVRQHSGEKFVEEVIVAGLGAKFVLAGPDLRFGHRRSGSATLLAEMGPKHGFSVEVADTVLQNENRISSTRIREVISEQGDMIEAQKLLSRPHRVSGIVVHGAKRGRELGFPTANLRTLTELIPLPGIYAANARCQDGSVHAAAVSVGHNPTFGTNSLTVEAFLLDFTGDLYGQTLDLDFHARLRGEAAFDSIDALLEQMNQDVLDTRRLLLSES